MEFVHQGSSRDGYSYEEELEEEVIIGSDHHHHTSGKQQQPNFSSSFSSSLSSPSSSHYRNDVVAVQQPFGGGGGGGAADVVCIEKEHMFDKVVTPSDVGKLNRLVIPKQHAEKYFPLDSTANEKGLLLNFEDRSGKPWRFRYSYWNSSQSYVMTKGWSRFVKEKKLDAGDIVTFERGADESVKDRFFIDWRRRPNAHDHLASHHLSLPRTVVPWGRLFVPHQNAAPMSMSSAVSMPREHMQLNYDPHQHHYYHPQQHPHQISSSSTANYGYNPGGGSGSVFYLRSSAPQQQVIGLGQQGGGRGGGGGDDIHHDNVPMVFDSVPVVHGKAAAKRVRLFGVNLDCPIQEDPNNEFDILSSTTIPMNTSTMGGSSLAHSAHQIMMNNPSHPLHPPLQLRVYSGAPLPAMPTELPKRGRPSLSFDLDV